MTAAGGEGEHDEERVELVDALGRTIGTAGKLETHRAPGRLHRAVSVLLLDGDGRLIVQRRAATKYHSAGRWANTCCGHPGPGEAPEAAARRRLRDELGLAVGAGDLIPAGVVTYEVSDAASGLAEREYDHLFVGIARAAPVPSAREVDAVATVSLDDPRPVELRRDGFAAWYELVVAAATPALRAL